MIKQLKISSLHSASIRGSRFAVCHLRIAFPDHVMGPVKTAKEVLSDDYQTSGYQLKAKQKTGWQGAVLTSAVDLLPDSKECVTPAKLTVKLPSPFGCPFFVVDKLEVDKKGGLKVEASTEKVAKGLKIEVKPELKNPMKTKTGLTYSALKDGPLWAEGMSLQSFSCCRISPRKDVRLAADFTGIQLQDTVAEITVQPCPSAVIGAKMKAPWCPEVGVRAVYGNYFAALLAKEKFSEFTASCHYKAMDNVRVAGSYVYGGKKSGNFTLGLAYSCNKNTTMKVKVEKDMAVSCGVKQTIAKGFTLLGGMKFDTNKGERSYGLQLSIE
eukprot:Skav211465  [mRNA]  locus=scaffold379:289930:301597:- [translate_table: standard]